MIGHDGRILDKTMPYWNFRYLTDEDLASIIVFLRTIPAVHHPLPKRDLAEQPVIDWRPEVQPPPSPSDSPGGARRGEYWFTSAAAPGATPLPIRRIGLCRACCSPGAESSSARGAPSRANLTLDPSGIGYYDEAQFIRTIRRGRVGARALNRTMPYPLYRHLNDDDLKATFAYLQTLPPVQHRVDNTEAPTLCSKDKNRHGFGDRN